MEVNGKEFISLLFSKNIVPITLKDRFCCCGKSQWYSFINTKSINKKN